MWNCLCVGSVFPGEHKEVDSVRFQAEEDRKPTSSVKPTSFAFLPCQFVLESALSFKSRDQEYKVGRVQEQ